MKLLKSLTLGVALAATLGTASAVPTTIVNLSGSTAFRKAVHAAIIDYLSVASNNPVGSTAALCAYDSANGVNAGNASAITFVSNDASNSIAIECYWSGSAAGTIDLVAGNTLTQFVDPQIAITNNVAATHPNLATVSGGSGVAGPGRVSGVVDYAFVDTTYQTVASSVAGAVIGSGSTTTGGATTGGQLQALIAGSGLVEAGTGSQTAVGIVPFAWYLGNLGGNPVPFTNITTEVARTLLTAGSVPLPFLTNNSADSSAFVYLLGRAQDSGTRATTLVNSEFPVGSAVKQWLPTFSNNQTTLSDPNFATALQTGGTSSSGTATVIGAGLWNPNNIITAFRPNFAMNTNTNVRFSGGGNYGFIGGGDLKNALSAANTNATTLNIPAGPKGPGGVANAGAYFVGYLSTGDGGGILNGTRLTFNGVDIGNTSTFPNIQNGSYTFWSYEHSYTSPVNTTAESKAVADAIADILHTSDAGVSGLLINSSLLAQKLNDGGLVTKNY